MELFDFVFPSHIQAQLDAHSQKPYSPRIPISIDDHVSLGELREHDTPSLELCGSWRASKRNIDNVETLVEHALKALSQQVDAEQPKSDCTTQNIGTRLAYAVEEASSVMEDPGGRGSRINTKAPQAVDNNRKRKGKYSSPTAGKTMMICNVPCRIGYDDLLAAIESSGFGGKFEFIHIPYRFGQSTSNLGYAFVHFFRWEDATSFALAFEGYRFANKESNKACTVKVADCQGTNARLQRRLPRNLRNAQRECEWVAL